MGQNPYNDLPSSAFWKTGVAEENPYLIDGIYKKKFSISPKAKIVTAGSCFAQHITRHLKKNGYNVLDVEPAPPGLPETLHQKHGFSTYSARYGNIYSVRQLLQLAQEVTNERTPQNYIWKKNGKYFDALRPNVEPEGLDSQQEVIEHRQYHLKKVREAFEELDLFIFTLGLTEMWVDRASGTVFPTAPGTIAGEFNDKEYAFENAQFRDVVQDFNQFQSIMKQMRGNKSFKTILTVSPVPLTATASGKHVLVSTAHSKSILRAAAGQLSHKSKKIDYFPSYEIATNPRLHSTAFSGNLRSIRDETVDTVMRHFFSEHPAVQKKYQTLTPENELLSRESIQCEEAILEMFAQ